MSAAPPRIAVVLSGGGARGAYEAGVLFYLMQKLPAVLGRPVRFDIISGSSVGAIHACFLAGHAGEPEALAELIEIWRGFAIEEVMRLTPFRLLSLPARLFGIGQKREPIAGDVPSAPQRIPGLLDFSPLEQVIVKRVPWSKIPDKIAAGAIDAVAVATTEVKTGWTIIFVDNREGRVDGWARDPFVFARSVRLAPEHALASAAIPLIFPAIRIGESFYCDGSLRLNTPLSPALRLGADRVLVIGMHYQRPKEEPAVEVSETSAGSPAFLAGKVLNALLLDRVDYDVDRLHLFNKVLEEGLKTYGPDFLEHINRPIVESRGKGYRIVRDFFLRPSRDLGVLASECLAHRRPAVKPGSWLSRIFLHYAAKNTGGEADFLSYLYFDGCYASHLIELGMADAERHKEELAAFFS